MTSDRRPILALAAIVIGVAIVYAGAAQLVSTPRVHPDEHIYGGGGASLGEGDGLRLRGEPYELGPVYPTILATVLVIAGDRETAYHLYKVVNGLLFALAALPLYLVARRLLRPWWSVGVAAFSIAIPSSMYVALVMTESASYLAFSIALLAIVLALERPSAAGSWESSRQSSSRTRPERSSRCCSAHTFSHSSRVWLIAPNRASLRELARQLWPTLAALVAGFAVLVVRPLVTGSSPLDAVGAYQVLFRGYDPLDIVRWSAYHLADLELYLAVVPIAVAPIVLALLWRRAGAGSRPAAAFVAAFVTVNAAMLFVTAAFASTEFGFDRLHDRNVFYLAPLWLIALGVWLAEGLPRPRIATAVGIVTALVLLVVLPVPATSRATSEWTSCRARSGPDSRSSRRRGSHRPQAHGRSAFSLLLALVAVLPRRLAWVFPCVLLATFAATAALAWERIADATENAVFEGSLERRWVDELLPDDAQVTKVYLVTTECPASAVTWHALYLTEFFNRSLERAAYIGDSIPDGLPIRRVDVMPAERLAYDDGRASGGRLRGHAARDRARWRRARSRHGCEPRALADERPRARVRRVDERRRPHGRLQLGRTRRR